MYMQQTFRLQIDFEENKSVSSSSRVRLRSLSMVHIFISLAFQANNQPVIIIKRIDMNIWFFVVTTASIR